MMAAVAVPPGDRSTAPLGRHGDASKVGAPIPGRSGEDRPVDPAQGLFQRMNDRARGFHGLDDFHADAPQLGQLARADAQPDGLAVDDGVERPAERDVGAKDSRTELEGQPAGQHERRHVRESTAPVNAREPLCALTVPAGVS